MDRARNRTRTAHCVQFIDRERGIVPPAMRTEKVFKTSVYQKSAKSALIYREKLAKSSRKGRQLLANRNCPSDCDR